MSAQISLRGCLVGHNGWITSIAPSPADADTVITSSRDETCMIWKIQAGEPIEDPSKVLSLGTPVRSLHGHSHIVQDVCLTYDGQYALSASWDNTLRLWNLTTVRVRRLSLVILRMFFLFVSLLIIVLSCLLVVIVLLSYGILKVNVNSLLRSKVIMIGLVVSVLFLVLRFLVLSLVVMIRLSRSGILRL